MTPAERLLWEHLRAHRLRGVHFQRQYVVDRFIADFYCHAAKLVVEVDGEVHMSQVARDEERDRVLGGLGYRVLRFTNEQVLTGVYEVVRCIAQALEGSDPSPGPSPK